MRHRAPAPLKRGRDAATPVFLKHHAPLNGPAPRAYSIRRIAAGESATS